MALTRRAPAAKFETPADQPPPPAAAAAAAAAATPAAPAEKPAPAVAPTPTTAGPAPAPAPAAAPATAVAVAPAKPLAIQVPQAANAIAAGLGFMAGFKDALRVDWDTLPRMKANQGRIVSMIDGNKIEFGKWFDFELLSYQDNWLISPGADTDEAKELAAYSDDGVHVKATGELCKDYIERLKGMGYENARLGQRLVLVISLVDCEGDVTVDDGKLFQIDLAPTSRKYFDQFKNQAAFDISKGRLDPACFAFIRAKASIEQQRGNAKNEYTVLSFSASPAA